ncbi:hypothetical protein EIP91_009360 [Steccherinum ochraceum]|uniref:F-box domain-containing protein n=1 Tax=Steccherinum ochraceum TaxID=92696 RepID=A0A4R0RJX9_9APHY|nr:hypothetical protein EIP91_009360 [Steccherinum ochraceum]
MSALLQRRNALVPILYLPPEILSTIFQHCVDEAFQTWFPCHWIPEVAHICHYWRQVAVTTPTLWAKICLSDCGPDMLRAFLERSSTVPMLVDTGTSLGSDYMDQWHLLFVHFNRIQAFTVRWTSYWQLDSLQDLEIPARTTNSLRTLTLAGSYSEIRSEFPLANTGLHEHLTSSLERLSISRYIISWNPAFFPKTLTHFRVHYDPRSGPLADVVEVISGLSALQKLNLKYCIDYPYTEPDAAGSNRPLSPILPPKKVFLPFLTSISLCEHSILPAIQFFLHFRLPPQHHARIHIQDIREDQLSLISDLLPETYSSHGPIRCAKIDMRAKKIFLHGMDAQSGTTQILEFKHGLRRRYHLSPVWILCELCARLQLDAITEFHITLPSDTPCKASSRDPLEHLLRALEPMVAVRTLSVSSEPETLQGRSTLASILCHKTRHGGLLLPLLERLVIDDVAFRVVSARSQEDFEPPDALSDGRDIPGVWLQRCPDLGLTEMVIAASSDDILEEDLQYFLQDLVEAVYDI